jgi:hypothetical protein
MFSLRYARAIERGTLSVELSPEIRNKLWAWLGRHGAPLRVRPSPYDDWDDRSSILEEVAEGLKAEHSWDAIEIAPGVGAASCEEAMRHVFTAAAGPVVLDAIELAWRYLDDDRRERLRRKVNQVLELGACPWRLSDGEFFRLDADFLGARLAATAHETLAANRFSRAADEYAKARRAQEAGDAGSAVDSAGKSFERVLAVLTGLEHANADRLLKTMLAQGFFDDLPRRVRRDFVDQVMKVLPFLRDRLAGHGRRAAVAHVPPAYGALCIQLAAAFHNFLVAKHLQRAPPPGPDPGAPATIDDEIPF